MLKNLETINSFHRHVLKDECPYKQNVVSVEIMNFYCVSLLCGLVLKGTVKALLLSTHNVCFV